MCKEQRLEGVPDLHRSALLKPACGPPEPALFPLLWHWWIELFPGGHVMSRDRFSRKGGCFDILFRFGLHPPVSSIFFEDRHVE